MNRPRLSIMLVLFVCAVLLVLGAGGCGPSKRDLGNIAISKVEEYRRVKGRLPNSLSEVGVEEDESCPCYCKTSDNSYIVWNGTTLGESDTYDSQTKKWGEVGRVCSR
jgi:hypothetical protein